MRLSRFNWFILALSAALSVFGFWSFAITVPPIPEPLLEASGAVASAEARSRKGRLRIIRFRVEPSNIEFSYPDILGNASHVWDRIDRGVPVEVLYIQKDRPELWGLQLAGETMITPPGCLCRQAREWILGFGAWFCHVRFLHVYAFHTRAARRCLTIHSSRPRFAGRLNSGVRPL